jgi:hypothetical protein
MVSVGGYPMSWPLIYPSSSTKSSHKKEGDILKKVYKV